LLENGVERVKITDFGLARAADDVEITQTGLIAGTPQYMSPEQAKGEPMDARSDLFSLGSVLYTMCTGRPAFRAETTMGVIRRVCDDEPRPIGEVNAELPPWLEGIVEKLLAKNPDERIQSAAEVSELLGQCLAHVQNPANVPLPNDVIGRGAAGQFPQKPLPQHRADPLVESPPASARFNRGAAVALAAIAAVMVLAVVASMAMIVIGLALPAFQRRMSIRPPQQARPPQHAERIGAPTNDSLPPIVWEPTKSVGASDDGWIPIFNGKDLAGWKKAPDQPGGWFVEEGVLIGRGKPASGRRDGESAPLLMSLRGDYEDFHFRTEVLLDDKADGSIFFRATMPPGQERKSQPDDPTGYQIQFAGGKLGCLAGLSTEYEEVKPGEWFTLEITAEGKRVTVKVNGKTTADVEDDAHQRGHFVIWPLDPDGVVKFRALQIKELPAAPQSGEWKALFNRQDLAGWKPDPNQPGNWRVEDGILIGGGASEVGLLTTERSDYEDFHLRAEVLLDSAEADGGIFFRALPQLANECNFSFDPRQPAQQTGSLVVHKPDTKDSVWTSAPAGMAKPNEWMTVEVVVRGGLALTKVNGKTAAASNELCGNPRGHIMLQHFGPRTVVRFRQIEIKEMPPADADAARPAEGQQERNAVMWGPVRDGWQVGIGWKNGKTHYEASDRPEFELKVRNATDAEKSIRVVEPSNWDLWYSGGEELSVRIFGRDEQDVKLAPRETKTIDVPKPLIDLAGLAGGTYRVKVTTDVGDEKQQPADANFGFQYDGPAEPAFPAPGDAPLKHPDAKYADVAWGKPVLGLSVGIRVDTNPKRERGAKTDDAAALADAEFLLWNTGAIPADVNYIRPHPLDWQPQLRDQAGKEFHIEPILTGPKTDARTHLDPGQAISLGTTTLKGPWLSDRRLQGELKPGAYRVWSHFNCRRLDYGQLNLRITSGEATVEIKP
jgi:hypothetical protein